MNTQQVTAALILALLTAGCGPSRNAAPGRFGIESARIQYTISGPISGTETVWFTEGGAREARWSTHSMSVLGQTATSVEMSLLEGGWFYKANLSDGTGMKMQVPEIGPAMRAIGSITSGLTDGRKVGTEVIAGRECEVMEFDSPKARLWMWKNIPLKTEVDMMGQTSITEAVSVEESPAIPDEAMKVPEGITWTEIP